MDRDLSSFGHHMDPRDGAAPLFLLLTDLHQTSDLSTQIWQILNGLDFEGGSKIDIDKKFFFLDMDWLAPKGITENITACEEALGINCLQKSLFLRVRSRAISRWLKSN